VIYYYQPTVLEPNVKNWALSGQPSNMMFDSFSGGITWTPRLDQTSAGPIVLTVYDLGGAWDDQTFSITVLSQPPYQTTDGGGREEKDSQGRRFRRKWIWKISQNNTPVGVHDEIEYL
jgi:hypothetical protein